MKIDIDPDGLHLSATLTPAQMKWGVRGLTFAAVLGVGIMGNNAFNAAADIKASQRLLDNVTDAEMQTIAHAFCDVATKVDIPEDYQLFFLMRPEDGTTQRGLYFSPDPQYCLETPAP